MKLMIKNYGGSLKNPIFTGGEVHENPIYRSELPEKEGAWTVFRFKKEVGKKKAAGVFDGD